MHITSGKCEWEYDVVVETPVFIENEYNHCVRVYKKSGELVAAAMFDKYDL